MHMTPVSKRETPLSGARGLRLFAARIEAAAAIIMGLVTLLIFVSAFMRYIAGAPIPDAHDFGRLALGIAIFWGASIVNFSGAHISVDLLHAAVGPGVRRAMDIFATAIVLVAFGTLTVMMGTNAADVFSTGEYSYDLRLPIWPAYWLMVAGCGLATLVTALRLIMLSTGTEAERLETSPQLPDAEV